MGICDITLYVNNLEKSKCFYVKYFNAVAEHKKKLADTEIDIVLLKFNDGSRLRLVSRPEIVSSKKFFYDSGYRYFTFSFGSKEALEEAINRLKEDGYRILTSHVYGDNGEYETIVLDTENNQIVLKE